MDFSPRILATSGWVLVITGLLSATYLAFIALLLRDGLGPDSATSYGVEALQRFLHGFAVPGVASIGLFCCGVMLVRKAMRVRRLAPKEERGHA